MREPEHLDKISDSKPDIVVAIIGGNSIVNSSTNHEICEKLREFYKILRSKLPQTLIIAAQIEQRFYKENNRYNAPLEEEFKQRKNSMNKCLNRIKEKDNLLIISGKNRLEDSQYYKRDGIHLNDCGLKVYMQILKTTVTYALNNRK